ncbi:RNA polymerase sigma factor [Chryseobacterium luteum]|uniref:RNA polymerase subunit sigma-24 n=1 Tax=Chryseobacterium luteum TaxID=421531 RepID=A0A085Z0E1_9FLAO|nr:RNA polymerase sigma factor [Chryseobacterium luteum]KFE97904.1 RNA polymerase subunit sigma-24 [Chryseobacterium luteum]
MNFDEIYNTYAPKILRVCLGYFHDQEKAKDITQETFIAVWENFSKFENRSSIGTWIFRIATNKCLQEVQKQSKRPSVEFPPNLKQEDPDPDRGKQVERLYKYISELPSIDRIIISLFLEELSQEKIAEITGVSHANVRVKIHRIKEKLLDKFRSNEHI